MRTEPFAPPALGLGLAVLLLAGCQARAPQAQAPSPVQFEVTDLAAPSYIAPVTAPDGAVLDFPAVFDVEIRLVGIDPTTVQDLKTSTTAFTAECNGRPIAEPYSTKVIVFPYGVNAAQPTATSLGFKLQLSSRTLMELGQCLPRMPLVGSVHLQAQVLDASNVWYTSGLTLTINPPPVPPSSQGG